MDLVRVAARVASDGEDEYLGSKAAVRRRQRELAKEGWRFAGEDEGDNYLAVFMKKDGEEIRSLIWRR